MVFITGMLAQKQSLHKNGRALPQTRQTNRARRSVCNDTIEELPYADHIFQGEAEDDVAAVFEDLENGTAKERTKRRNGRRCPSRPSLIPDWST